jgi:uncharacterized iron-regulated protein
VGRAHHCGRINLRIKDSKDRFSRLKRVKARARAQDWSINNNMDDKPAYKLYDRNGRELQYNALLDDLAGHEVILFGEVHNNPIVHWLQLEVFKDLYDLRKKGVVIGAEMFEADVQIILNEYLPGAISHQHFVSNAEVWSN